jgi:hypothetical protein
MLNKPRSSTLNFGLFEQASCVVLSSESEIEALKETVRTCLARSRAWEGKDAAARRMKFTAGFTVAAALDVPKNIDFALLLAALAGTAYVVDHAAHAARAALSECNAPEFLKSAYNFTRDATRRLKAKKGQ